MQKTILKGTWSVELLIAVVLALLIIGVMTWQVSTAGTHSSATETFLFNILQFVLTTGFAWFSIRALSRSEFEQSLKRFAISAYRRIDDIERMVHRLHAQVQTMLAKAKKDEMANLQLVEAIIGDTSQVIRSSISDWGDVIGEELLALERIKRLQYEQELLR